jgi:16S rRNA (guanine527-N7)-methyltransferase
MSEHSLLRHYFPELTEEKLKQFSRLAEGYREWNAKVNLVSRADLDNLAERHILHSLALALFFRFESMTEIMDLGTGGGFPGLPLAIFFPECRFTLVDSIGKKIKVVEDLASQLQLSNVRALNARAESIQDQFDFVVTRAVAPAENLVNWTRGKFAKHYNHSLKNGILAWKGGDLSEELKLVSRLKPQVFQLKDYLKEAFFETKQIVHIPMS